MGNAFNFVSVPDLTMASLRNGCHQILVVTIPGLCNLPVLPKSKTLSTILRSNTVGPLHNRQNDHCDRHVTKLVIDDFVPHQDAQKIGLRLAVLDTRMTCSVSPSPSNSETGLNAGSSMGGMPSLSGPPDGMSARSMICLVKSVPAHCWRH